MISNPSNLNTPEYNPFYYAPYDAYDVSIKSDVDCYVNIRGKAAKKKGDIVYSLIENGALHEISDRDRRTEDGDTTTHGNLRRFLDGHGNDNKEGSGKLFLTHTSQCGVCSDLNSLASYLEFPAFEQDIAGCGALVLPQILNATGLTVNPTNFTQLAMQLGQLNAAVRFQALKLVVPSAAFKQLAFCVGSAGTASLR